MKYDVKIYDTFEKLGSVDLIREQEELAFDRVRRILNEEGMVLSSWRQSIH